MSTPHDDAFVRRLLDAGRRGDEPPPGARGRAHDALKQTARVSHWRRTALSGMSVMAAAVVLLVSLRPSLDVAPGEGAAGAGGVVVPPAAADDSMPIRTVMRQATPDLGAGRF